MTDGLNKFIAEEGLPYKDVAINNGYLRWMSITEIWVQKCGHPSKDNWNRV